MFYRSSALFALFLLSVSTLRAQSSRWDSANFRSFETKLESLREKYHIPGISVGVMHGKTLVWAKGFGYADLENKVVPDENTVYQVASITKTFGSIILLQQIEAGKAQLGDPISKYGINLGARWGSDPRIKIKHLFTHTAMGNVWNAYKPGYAFRYNGSWYHQLDAVIRKASGSTFGQLVTDTIIRPLGLMRTAPSTGDSASFALSGFDRDTYLSWTAKPYDWNKKKKRLDTVKNFRYGFGPAAGLMSTVADLAVYSAAIDEKRFLRPETWEQAWTPFVTERGKKVQYGLGWFVTRYKGVKMIWHTGWWMGYSALFLKVPEKDITFIILANSQDVSRPFYHIVQPIPGFFGMHNPFHRNLKNKVQASKFAKAFLDHFME
ncbi:serine hydrolase domain-containing protein [Chitinophaga sp. GCM10012297]|uniref:Beta-lactamase family protein n=1 Tax=Chitinophaga chungangae TaxID=2821488 RepID=A0ABS3YAZ1_9BACT|nr:serine hydrolase domain-containing protein [Chitinophaga chungangae]MBO9151645.1 beta-lactamase family protein [Chitinophaga chungangae]